MYKYTNYVIFFIIMNIFFSCSTARFVRNKNYTIKEINSIAIFPFSGNRELGSQLSDLIALNLFENNIHVIERTELNRILDEQGLSMTGLIDDNKIIEAGNISGADVMMFGTAIYKQVQWFYQGNYMVKNGIGTASIRLVDAKTGEIIGGVKFKNGEGVLNFDEDIDAIAIKITNEILIGIGKKKSF